MPGYYDEPDVGGEQTAESPPEKDSRDEKTALIPTILCPGLEPGDKVTLKVVATHEDEYEVVYDEEKESGKKTSEQPSMETAMENNRAPTSFLED